MLIDNNPAILVNYCASNVEYDQLKVLDELAHIFNQLQISENIIFIWAGDLDADGRSPKLKVKSLCKLLSMMSENDLCGIYIGSETQKQNFHMS